jgi:hypothetical protein
VIPGIVGSSQYVLPFTKIGEITYGSTSTTSRTIPPLGDGTNYMVYEHIDGDLMSAGPYPSGTYSDVYTTEMSSVNALNNSFKKENGVFLITANVISTIYKFTTLGGTLVAGSAGSVRTVRWFAPMNAWVAVGTSGVLFTSTDAETWTSRSTVGAGVNLNGMATDGTILVVGGNSGAIYTTTSTNPASISWTLRTSSFGTSLIRDIDYDPKNDYFVACSEGGKIAYSQNGTSWTQASTGISSLKDVVGVIFHAGKWLATIQGSSATSGDGEVIRSNTSLPSGTWTRVTSQPGYQSKIASDGRYAFWAAEGGKLRYTR